jgi:hypothetical protein
VAQLDSTIAQRLSQRGDWIRVLLMLGAALAALAVLTVIFGVTNPGPGYDIVADPAGALPF